MSWFAYSQNKKSKMQLERMFREMENLQKADDTLKDVQTKYEFILSCYHAGIIFFQLFN